MPTEPPPRVLIAQADYPPGLAAVRALLPAQAVTRIAPYPRDAVVPAALLRDCTVLVADFLPANVEDLGRLRWLQLGSAGYQQVRGQPWRTRRIRVTNASGVNDVPIAEWCLLLMLLWERELAPLLAAGPARAWDRPPRLQSELRGRRVGIVGYGGIGREVARLSKAAGLEVWALNRGVIGHRPDRFAAAGTGDPTGTLPDRAFTSDGMAEFLADLDYVVLTAALNAGSRGLLGERELGWLPPRAVLLNPARADLVDEAALRRALAAGDLRGAALDSHYREPLTADDPFWALPNVVLTPHISGSTGSPYYQARLWALIAANLDRYQRGAPLLNEIAWDDLEAT